MKRIGLIISLLVVGCSNGAPENDITKEEARARVGKGDSTFDFCAYMDWYGDGICDDFCANPDPDCDGDQYCYSDDDCAAGESCNAGEVCLSPCAEGMACPAVCAGFCVEEEPDACWGAWIDPATGACRAPNDGIYPDECCEAELSMCGGFSNLPCADDEWCDFGNPPEGAAADMSGVCKPRPTSCYEIYAPVCGNDGITYGNDCFAHMAGVDVAHEGECPSAICGGFAGFLCAEDAWCDFTDPPEGTAADMSGICRTRPTACTKEALPVCGRDGQSYGNTCSANAAGVDVLHDGFCE